VASVSQNWALTTTVSLGRATNAIRATHQVSTALAESMTEFHFSWICSLLYKLYRNLPPRALELSRVKMQLWVFSPTSASSCSGEWAVPQKPSADTVLECYRRAAEAHRIAAAATDPVTKADFVEIERRWRFLARTRQFEASADGTASAKT
jgi:hypothetical protein